MRKARGALAAAARGQAKTVRHPQRPCLDPFGHIPVVETVVAVMSPAVKGPTLVVPVVTIRPLLAVRSPIEGPNAVFIVTCAPTVGTEDLVLVMAQETYWGLRTT
jgi:hypothetical protein